MADSRSNLEHGESYGLPAREVRLGGTKPEDAVEELLAAAPSAWAVG